MRTTGKGTTSVVPRDLAKKCGFQPLRYALPAAPDGARRNALPVASGSHSISQRANLSVFTWQLSSRREFLISNAARSPCRGRNIASMKEIGFSEFKVRYSAVIEQVRKTRQPIRVMRLGEPLAEIVPLSRAKNE